MTSGRWPGARRPPRWPGCAGRSRFGRARLARPLGAKADKREGLARGYGSRAEWHAKSRRLHALRARLARLGEDWAAGRVRGGTWREDLAHLATTWTRPDWASRRGRSAGRRRGCSWPPTGSPANVSATNPIRVTATGQLSIKLPAPLAHLANAPHGRYVLDATVAFQHRGQEWRDRITANRAVAYRIHHDPARDRWYVTASWQRAPAPVLPLGGGPGAGGGRGGHERRPPRRLASGCARQPGR